MFIYENSNIKDKILCKDISNLSLDQINYLNHKLSGREDIDKYSDNNLNLNTFSNKEEVNNTRNSLKIGSKLRHNQLHLNIFRKNLLTINNKEIQNEKETSNAFNQIDFYDINLSSFLANINFIDHLCYISKLINSTSLDLQAKVFAQELNIVNKLLPSNIYVPFINDSIRNYVIVHIPISECKIFKTKNKAPYLLTFELIRLDELTL